MDQARAAAAGAAEEESSGEVPLHRRRIDFEAFDRGATLRVVGQLEDVRPWASPARTMVHHMEIDVVVRKADLVIQSARVKMHTFPHAECPSIEAAFQGLVGLSIGRGYTKAVSERFVGVLGCSHIEHLARALGPAVVQSMASIVGYQHSLGAPMPAPPERPSGGVPWLRNTCHIWAEGGIGEQKLALGAFPSEQQYPVPAVEVLIKRRQRTGA